MKNLILFFILLTFSEASLASKIDFMAGLYSFTGKVNDKQSKFSGIGTYQVSFLQGFMNKFEVNLGYTYTMTSVISGDYSYGPILGVNYYPFNYSSSAPVKINNTILQINEDFKPYVGLAFNQRQYQSVKTSYAGIGLNLGYEKVFNEHYTIKNELKYNNYTGASQATATEINILLGLVFSF